jgi:hypothetical protein
MMWVYMVVKVLTSSVPALYSSLTFYFNFEEGWFLVLVDGYGVGVVAEVSRWCADSET